MQETMREQGMDETSSAAALMQQSEGEGKLSDDYRVPTDHAKWLNTISAEHIGTCIDEEELIKIIEAMHEEGFIGLERLAEERLATVGKKVEKAMDTNALFEDLFSWEEEARESDAELKAIRPTAGGKSDVANAPVRQGVKISERTPDLAPSKPNIISAPKSKEAGNGARHTYDNYQNKWDKWDNSAYIEEVLEEEDEKQEEGLRRKMRSMRKA